MLPQSDDEFRRTVCAGCQKPGQKRTVSENFAAVIRKKLYSGYSTENEALPMGICNTCRNLLSRDKPFQPKFDYDILTKNYSRKNVNNGKCLCDICEAGRSKKLISVKGKPGPKPSSPTKVSSIKLCAKCGQRKGKGLAHKCSPTKKVKSIVALAETQMVKEKVASIILREKCSKDDSDITLKSVRGSLRVRMKPKPKVKKISHEDIDAFNMKLSGNITKSTYVAQGLRHLVGKNNVQPNC